MRTIRRIGLSNMKNCLRGKTKQTEELILVTELMLTAVCDNLKALTDNTVQLLNCRLVGCNNIHRSSYLLNTLNLTWFLYTIDNNRHS